MLATVIVLGTIMAVFAVIGYRYGARASFFTLAMVIAGLALIARGGGTIARLINGVWFGLRFVAAGGLAALSAPGDRAAAIAAVIRNIGPVQPIVDPNSPGPELILLLLLLVLLSLLLGRSQRLRLAGPASGWGIIWGLMSGYLMGAYLLVHLLPAQSAYLWLPFGLHAAAATPAPGTPAAGAGGGQSLVGQFISGVQGASQGTLALIAMVIIALFVILAVLATNRGGSAGRSGRNGSS